MLFKRCYCFQEPLADMNTLCLPSMVTYLFFHDAIRVTGTRHVRNCSLVLKHKIRKRHTALI
jgi:hypothetical protein